MEKLFVVLLLTGFLSCKKENKIIEYKVVTVERPGTFACKYTLAAPGRTPITIYDECGKFVFGQTVLKVVE